MCWLQIRSRLILFTIQYNTIELYCPVNGKFVCSVRVKVNKNTIVIKKIKKIIRINLASLTNVNLNVLVQNGIDTTIRKCEDTRSQ